MLHSDPATLRSAAIPPAPHALFYDVETYSTCSLKTAGAHQYAAAPATDVWCVSFVADHGPMQLWRRGEPTPPEFFEATTNPAWIAVAHNAIFEAEIMRHVLAPRYGFPSIPIERHRCTMAMCLALGLPAKLGAVADVLELANRKDAAGERLMHQMARPRKPRKDEDSSPAYWHDDPERLQRLGAYCCADGEVTRELYYRLPLLTDAEQALWARSCVINERGFHIDRQFAEKARLVAEAAGPEINSELAEITAGEVTGINQVARLIKWLHAQRCPARTLTRDAVERQLAKDDLSASVRRVLELRLGGAQAAVKKISALLARAGDDDRVRGSFKFHGAATGRWSGEGPQPQNLKRPVVKDLDAACAAVATGDYAHVKRLYEQPLAVVGDCTRSMITAAPGHILIGADYNAVEARVLPWVADERWKLDAYRRFDATQDLRDEPYLVTACRIFRVPEGTFTKDSPERAVGKTCTLAFGYQGGLGAFRKFEPDKFTDEEVTAFKNEWRAAHPATVKLWYDVDRAAVLAVRSRHQVVRCGRVAFKCTGAYLQLKLPSGRKISYPQPRLITDKHGRPRVVFADNAAGKFTDCRFGQGAYGGLWTENVVSGIARDLLAEAMLRVEAAGYPIVLHVHDELVAEVPEGFGDVKEFTHLIIRKPAWATDLPIAAAAWAALRYVK